MSIRRKIFNFKINVLSYYWKCCSCKNAQLSSIFPPLCVRHFTCSYVGSPERNVVFFCHNFCISYIWCGQERCQKIGRYKHIRIYLWLRIFLVSSPTSSKKVKVHVCNLTLYWHQWYPVHIIEQTINLTNPPILLSFFKYFVHILGRQWEAIFCLWIINLQNFGELVFGIPYFFDIRFCSVVFIFCFFFNFLLVNFFKPSGFKFWLNYRYSVFISRHCNGNMNNLISI